ncbi:MAG: phospho-sugar mutase, partial [Bacilli bacterium]
AQAMHAQMVMVADPDADRVGLAYRDEKDQYQLLDGNQSGALLIEYLFSQRQKLNNLPSNGVLYDTIVTSPLGRKIAHHYKVKTETFLTGFKFIGDRIDFYQHHAGPQFLFGYEESYGCLIGDFVRDKDAIQALTLYAEMALHHAHNGVNLGQALDRLHQTFGYHLDKQFSLSLSGTEGEKFLQELMDKIRKTPFKPFQQFSVKLFEDYLMQVSKDDQGHASTISLPKANVLKLSFHDGSSIIVRPSGTEPKCKFYFLINGSNLKDTESKLEQYLKAFSTLYLSADKRLK